MTKFSDNKFFIVGAAKSGTTAITAQLGRHPEVFICPMKETKFISSQFLEYPLRGPGDEWVDTIAITTRGEYDDLFRNMRGEKAIGEASVENLYFYERAIPEIKKQFGDPRIVIALRNPVERAFSAYMHLRRDMRETLSFEDALEEEECRIQNNWDHIWFYKSSGLYYQQVRAYLESFSRVKVMILDDIKSQASHFFRDLFQFLDVSPEHPLEHVQTTNISGVPKSDRIQLLFRPGRFYAKLYRTVVRRFGWPEDKILRFVESLWKFNLKRISMRPETRTRLTRYFAEDVARLGLLLDRDLSHWLPAESTRFSSRQEMALPYRVAS
ncbi:MAG: sulfotransferase [Spirochaetales bacterium]|nr:sulfotransferase [Spirochaetales bacterium]